MSRARYRNDWFHRLSDDAHFEAEFERLILQNAELLDRSAVVIPFKEIVEADGLPPRRADLALVDQQYRYWWVIEVELIGHSLTAHVVPQVRTFVEGRYNERHIAALLRGSDSLDENKLRAMMLGEPPHVVVISNRFDPKWEAALTNEGAAFSVMNVYRSDTNRDIFVVEGHLPEPLTDCLSEITPHRMLPGFFRVRSPGGLPLRPDKTLQVFLAGKLIVFTLMETATDWFLMSNERLRPVEYAIFAGDDGVLVLKERRV